MIRRWFQGAAAMMLIATVSMCGSTPARAAPVEIVAAGTLDLVSVTPWVDPDGDWVARFRTGAFPAGSTVTYSIRQPLNGTDAAVRDELQRLVAGEITGSGLQGPNTVPIALLPTADGVATLDVPVRSASGANERSFLPNAGIHPVLVSIDGPDRNQLAHQVLFLNRLPAAGSRPPMPVAIEMPFTSTPMLTPDGNLRVDDASRAAVEALIVRLDAVAATPVSVSLAPHVVAALAGSADPADVDLLARLRAAMAPHHAIRTPWSPLHLESWAESGSLADLQTSILQGQQALASGLGVPIDAETWPLDATVGPRAISALGPLGVRRIVVDPARLTPIRQTAAESQSAKTFTLADARGTTLQAMAIDAGVRDALLADGPTAVKVNLALTELLAPWFTATSGHRGAVLVIDDQMSVETAAALSAALSGVAATSTSPPMRIAGLDEVFGAVDALTVRSNGKTAPLTRNLSAAPATVNVARLSRSLDTLRSRLGSYRSIFTPKDPAVTTVADLMATAQDRTLRAEDQFTYVRDATSRIEADLEKISVPKPRSLTVTARDATIPLRFTNDLPRDAHVRLHLRSPLLEFTSGQARDLVLKAGTTTRIDVPVRVQASGQFLLTVELRSADDNLVIASGRQSIRSTSFSGVGLILSGGALVFLVVWWIRTLRSRNADRSDERQPEPEEAAR